MGPKYSIKFFILVTKIRAKKPLVYTSGIFIAENVKYVKRGFGLILGAHSRLDIEVRIDFFAWIENIIRIKDVFSLYKQFKHIFTKHFV